MEVGRPVLIRNRRRRRRAAPGTREAGGGAMDDGRRIIVTSCGRRLTTGRFVLPAAGPIGRVTLRIDPVQGDGDAVLVSLTAAEASGLAEALLAQARRLDDVPARQAGGSGNQRRASKSSSSPVAPSSNPSG